MCRTRAGNICFSNSRNFSTGLQSIKLYYRRTCGKELFIFNLRTKLIFNIHLKHCFSTYQEYQHQYHNPDFLQMICLQIIILENNLCLINLKASVIPAHRDVIKNTYLNFTTGSNTKIKIKNQT
jgi:hypothetical protein